MFPNRIFLKMKSYLFSIPLMILKPEFEDIPKYRPPFSQKSIRMINRCNKQNLYIKQKNRFILQNILTSVRTNFSGSNTSLRGEYLSCSFHSLFHHVIMNVPIKSEIIKIKNKKSIQETKKKMKKKKMNSRLHRVPFGHVSETLKSWRKKQKKGTERGVLKKEIEGGEGYNSAMQKRRANKQIKERWKGSWSRVGFLLS